MPPAPDRPVPRGDLLRRNHPILPVFLPRWNSEPRRLQPRAASEDAPQSGKCPEDGRLLHPPVPTPWRSAGQPSNEQKCLSLRLLRWFRSRQRVRVRIAAQKCIQVFNTTEIGTDGDVLHRALMFVRFFGLIPRALILNPRYRLFRCRQIYIHVRPMEFRDK